MGSCTELEVEWAELIKKIVPSARDGYVRATSCGTEAILMAIRLSRIYTGRNKIVVHLGCYHGKGDLTICAGQGPPIKYYNVRGIPKSVMDDVIVIPFNNLEAAEKALQTGDVACLIIQGNALFTKDYIVGLRKLTSDYGVVFILDEVISGFRYAAGGAQEYYGVVPDLSALGKIPGGGAPIGAICGKKDILQFYEFRDDYWNRFVRIKVGGTWNAQPICIAGGIAAMKIIDEERNKIYPRIYEVGRRLTKSFNDAAEDLGVSAVTSGLPYDNPTLFAINLLKKAVPPEKRHLWQTGPRTFEEYAAKAEFNAGAEAYYANYLNLINNGIFAYGGRTYWLCIKHSDEDVQKTAEAFESSLRILKENNLVAKT